MADSPYVQLREQYRAQLARNETLADHISAKVGVALRDLGIYASVSRRVKNPDSFATKALIGHYANPIDDIGDQVGVRVVVSYLEHVDRVETLVRDLFDVIRVEDKLDALDFNQIGYLGRHIDLRLRESDSHKLGTEYVGLRAEIQVRTTAQSAWADVAHEQLYKPDADVPKHLKRRVFRLVSLVELFDQEVAAFLVAARSTPGYAEAVVLKPLTEVLLRDFDDRRQPDRQLSLVIAAALVPLYEMDFDLIFEQRLEGFIEKNQGRLRISFNEARDEGDPNPLLHQPEIFMIFERLERDRLRLQVEWPADVPQEWLLDAAERWNIHLGDA